MHGTFRTQFDRDAVATVRFGALEPTRPRSRRRVMQVAALLAGCCLALLPQARPDPAPRVPAVEPPSRVVRPAVVTSHEVSVAPRVSPPIARPARPAPIRIAVAPAVRPRLLDVPAYRPVPAPTQAAEAQLPSLPRVDVAPPAVVAAVDVPAPTYPIVIPLPEPSDRAPTEVPLAPARTPRPVDIAQISDSDVRSLRVPAIHEPGLAAGGEPTLAAKIAQMQVTPLPPVRLRESYRAALLAEAPTRMMVRIGDSALGMVDFRMGQGHEIDVRLGNLLDVLAGAYDPAEFARLRTSAAADAYVSFDQLRALGLNLRYDPVYDELRISG